MKNALILHSIQGNPHENWLPWIKGHLEEKGYQVYLPQIPIPDRPNLEVTWDIVKDNFEFNEESLIIGHSSGATLALGILQKLPEGKRIKRTILVAAFVDPDLLPKIFEYLNPSDYKDLFPGKWDWEKIRNSSGDFIIFDSSNDPFVQLRHGDFLERELGGKRITHSGAKHFSVFTAGEKWRQFPEILEYI